MCANVHRRWLVRLYQLLIVLAFMVFFQSPSTADILIDGVPIPADVTVAAVESSKPAAEWQWVGAWVGAWGGTLKHILLVESVAANGQAHVVYSIGANPLFRIQPAWKRLEATVSGDSLRIAEPGFSATYEMTDPDALKATYTRGSISSQAALRRVDLAALIVPGAMVDWTRGKSERLQTDLIEAGKLIRLEVVVFMPQGSGPFPLAVINHGSTGNGDNPALFTETWFDLGIADFLNARGWIVAFPQRRGRGKSDGLYDEGFAPDRAKGYTCDPEISLAGAERALHDIEAAIPVIRRRSDVASSPILIGGQSRGGALSVAYAGDHPEQIFGVLNFVGGWAGEGCSSAKAINETLFQKGGRFRQPTLWLYGRGDRFYSLEHSRRNFVAFQKTGGRGTFLEFDVPSGNGHGVIGEAQLWSNHVAVYVNSLIGVQEK